MNAPQSFWLNHPQDGNRRKPSRSKPAFSKPSSDTPSIRLVFLDKQFNFIRVNQAYASACQLEPEEFIGRNHFEFYPDAENQAIFEEVVRSKEPYVASAKAFSFPDHPEWGVTYWDWTLVPVLNADDEVDFLFFALIDVTRAKRAEESLRSSYNYSRSLLEASLDPLVTISTNGKITDVNKATELATGVSRTRLIGSNFSDYFTDPKKANDGYQRVFEEGLVRDYLADHSPCVRSQT